MTQRETKLAYSISEFAEVAGLGRSFLYEEIKARRLKVRKAGRRSIILEDEARAYLQSLPSLVPDTAVELPATEQGDRDEP